jgi:hypothetical protein
MIELPSMQISSSDVHTHVYKNARQANPQKLKSTQELFMGDDGKRATE